jgi:uncharacterized protein (TIGR03437 family)
VRKTNSFITWQMVLMSLLVLLCSAQIKPAYAQAEQGAVEKIPGIPAGYTIIDGDIQMPIGVANAMTQRGQQERPSPNSPQATFNNNLWPNGVVPFQFETRCELTSSCATALPGGCVGLPQIAAMLDAMKLLSDTGRIFFRQCPNNRCRSNINYVNIRDTTNDVITANNSNACVSTSKDSSPVGMQGGQQGINISQWTAKFVIVHELMHTLGFFHEQSSPLRDTYVDVATYCNNVMGGCMGKIYDVNFPKNNNALTYGGYDFDSVMHYGQCSFSVNDGTVGSSTGALVPACPAVSPTFPNGGITIVVKAPYTMQWQGLIGQITHLSTIDRLTLMQLYPQPNWRFVDGTNTAPRQFGSFLDPYASLEIGINATPVGGTLWVQPGLYYTSRPLTKRITIRAPLGGATILYRQAVLNVPELASVSAASYNGELAAESIVAAFGENLAAGTAIATTLPLPTQLAGATVKVKDADGAERDAPLFFVSPNQINYQIPTGTSIGIASISVQNSSGETVAKGTVPITTASPALFSANTTGQGVPAASLLRVRGDAQFYEPLARYDAEQKQFVPVPIDLGPEGDQVFLILFGTGFRASGTSGVMVTIGDEDAEVLYAGPAPGFAGLDQANVRIPRSLISKGEVAILLTADSRSSNAVTISIR